MTKLLQTSPTTEDEALADMLEVDGQPLVLPKGSPLVKNTAITEVVEARDDSYGTGSSVMFSYPEMSFEENTWFQPTKPTKFQIGDKLIMAHFVPSSPGGWIVTDLNLSRREYWQEGTIDATTGEEGELN
jgi:hypothetical protein